MDALQLIAALEGLRDKIPGFLLQDFENLIASIRHTYEMSVKQVTPPPPVHAGKQNLASHHATMDALYTQLDGSLTAFQQVYVGQGSEAYHARATASLQGLQVVRDHLAQASTSHNTMATNFELATEAKLALVALLVGLGITLAVLIGSAGTTAPVTVPAAALEVAGGGISIGVMVESTAAAAAAIAGLVGTMSSEALLTGLGAFVTVEVLGHGGLHPPTTITWPTTHPNVPTNNGPQGNINEARAHQDELPISGTATGPNVYVPPKSAKGDPGKSWDKVLNGFKDANGNVWVWDKFHNDHWDVQLRDGSHINVFPDGVERGQRENNKNQEKGKK